MSAQPGRLVLAATPIGDVADAPARLAELISSADVVAAEDTRRLLRLAAALGVQPSGRVISYHEHNEVDRGEQLVSLVAGGATVLLVTDGGMPSVSDPGLRAVRVVVEAGLPVTAVPGPSAALTALALSGLATDRFCFEGFPPRGASARRRALAALAREPRTMIFFESRHRIVATLGEMAAAFGAQRAAAVCRELTKTYEQVRRGPLSELAEWAAASQPLGEITVVVAGAPAAAAGESGAESIAELVARVERQVSAGTRRKDAIVAVAKAAGLSKNRLYDAVVAARRQGDVASGQLSVRLDPNHRPGVEEVRELYLAAFSPPPMNEGEHEATVCSQLYGRLRERSDLTLAVARDAGGALVGLCYGHPWWWDRQDDPWSRSLRAALNEGAAGELDGSFAVHLLVVHPRHRRAGLGNRLLTATVARAGLRRAWLQTRDIESPAPALYRRLGWRIIGHGTTAPDGSPGLVHTVDL